MKATLLSAWIYDTLKPYAAKLAICRAGEGSRNPSLTASGGG
jgi:hypothetical protein